MKTTVYLLISIVFTVGCSRPDSSTPSAARNTTGVSTDTQDDLWHAHRHVHDEVQVHDHEHHDGFEGGHQHPHGHTHRHAETLLGGIVVSLQRSATPGQLPGGSLVVPRRPHLEILPGLPSELRVCLLSENLPSAGNQGVTTPSEDLISPFNQTNPENTKSNPQISSKINRSGPNGSWGYWDPKVTKISIYFQLEGTEYVLACEKRQINTGSAGKTGIPVFAAKLPENLRQRLTSTNARLRVAKVTVEIGTSRLRVREQIYFQGEELYVFLQ
ncbi:MAG TPA: hypothetical protein DEF45_18575 [Rhodopirellula sp.]|nr:hypothetical protein [Rhodopirellula sp.]